MHAVRSSLVAGRLGALIAAAVYFALGTWVLMPVMDWLHPAVAGLLGVQPGLTPGFIALEELEMGFVALICTALLGSLERRRPDSYGLPLRCALRQPTWEGVACGVAIAGFVAVGMLVLGGMKIHGVAAGSTTLLYSAAAWLFANVCIGLAEEFWFRSYLLQTLWRGVGFWPAAGIIAVIFTAEHYFFKQGENIWDVLTLMSLSLLLCYSVLRTGTLWFAVGFHVAFDYMQLFVIGTPNGSRVPVGHLLEVTFQGPAWITGGALGTEASFLMYPAIALLWLYVARRYRGRPDLGENSISVGANVTTDQDQRGDRGGCP